MTGLVDTGPLVSAFARRESRYKSWAERVLASLPVPLVTCEAVLTEATAVRLPAPKTRRAIGERAS